MFKCKNINNGKHRNHRRNGLGRGFRRENSLSLLKAQLEKDYYVVGHYDKKILEMGFYCGAEIRLIRNEDSDNNIIVALGNSRYSLNKQDAEGILISEYSKRN